MNKIENKNMRKKLLRETLQIIFDFHEVNKKARWGEIMPAYEERKIKYHEKVQKLEHEKGAPLTKIELSPIRQHFRIAEISREPSERRSWQVPLCAIFKTFYKKAEIKRGAQLRKQITIEDLKGTLSNDPKYETYLEEAEKVCGNSDLRELWGKMGEMRLNDYRVKQIPRPNNFYIVHSPKIKAGLGEESFSEVKKLYFEISEYDLAEFDATMRALESSLVNEDETIDFSEVGSGSGRRKVPLRSQKCVEFINPMSVYKKTQEYSYIKKDWAKENLFGSEFEKKLCWLSHESDTVYDSFSGTWENFNEFIKSIFYTYFQYAKNLNRIGICLKCGKLYAPESYDKSRNKFCSPKCRKDSHRNKDTVKCYNRQRVWFKGKSDVVRSFCRQKQVKEENLLKFDGIKQRAICSAGKCPHEFYPASGNCEMFKAVNQKTLKYYKYHLEDISAIKNL